MAGPSRSAPAAGDSRHHEYKVQPPRPPNAWILYRSFRFEQIRKTNERISQAAVSKRISDMWRTEDESIKRHFEQMAEDKKAEHQQLYPDYRFAPKKKEAKIRAKEDRKQSRLAKKSKDRDATPADTDADATPTVPALPPMPYMPQPYHVPGYQPNMVLPYSCGVPYFPDVHYGPGGPSPPISAAPSPAPYENSKSPEERPYPEENVASSSSGPSTRPSPSSESQASSSSSQLPADPLYLPDSHQPSPNPYATQPLSTLLFQTPAPGELSLISPQLQLPSAENTVTPAAPAWNNIPTHPQSLDFQNSEEVINFDIPINQTQNFVEFQQCVSGGASSESLQGLLSMIDRNGVFSLSNVDPSDFLAQPQGELEVAMGPQASTVDYNGEFFADFDYVEFERQMASLAQSGSSSVPTTSPSTREDLQSLFQAPNNPEIQAYTTAQQRQPSVFTQDMMHFFNFEAAEDVTEDTSSTVSPVPTTVAPQQVRLQSTQHGATMPIFTQMTNTPTVASGTSYVPPAGAIYSSTRRVAGSWKPSFVTPPSQVEEPVQSWTYSTN